MQLHYLWSKHIAAFDCHRNDIVFCQPTINSVQPKCTQRRWASQHWIDPRTNPPAQHSSVSRCQIQEKHKLFQYQNQRSKSVQMVIQTVVHPVHRNRLYRFPTIIKWTSKWKSKMTTAMTHGAWSENETMTISSMKRNLSPLIEYKFKYVDITCRLYSGCVVSFFFFFYLWPQCHWNKLQFQSSTIVLRLRLNYWYVNKFCE